MFYVYLVTEFHTAMKTYETEEQVQEELPKMMRKFEEMVPGQILHAVTAMQELSEEELGLVIEQGMQFTNERHNQNNVINYLRSPATIQ